MADELTAFQQEVLAGYVANIGVAEDPLGSNSGPSVDVYLASVGLGSPNPWCAALLCYRLKAAAEKMNMRVALPSTGSTSALYRWCKGMGYLIEKPIPVCIGMLRGGPTGEEHTFLVESVDWAAGVVHSIDGNWGNRVARTTHPIANCYFAHLPC